MCGIAGFVKLKQNHDQSLNILNSMSLSLKHRGPDSKGLWIDKNDGVYLCHRRLSIIDLSVNGHQPMISGCKRFILTFNGEIYNFKQLRKILIKKNIGFIGTSDTEVILNCFTIYGIEKTLSLLEGMFSIAVWDSKKKVMFLIRDRLGEKPLYYSLLNGNIVFSSELKAIRKFYKEKLTISKKAFDLFFYTGFVPAPYSIFEEINKLNPGQLIIYKDGLIKKKNYWSIKSTYIDSIKNRKKEVEPKVDKVHNLIKESVKNCMIADVEVGCFLSGGIDSSLMAAIMQKNSMKKIKTFTVGFKEKEFDESNFARKISDFIGTEHNQITLSLDDIMFKIEGNISLFDEPFGDSSMIPTQLVSNFASESLKVVISGDGGDEFFLGYNRYIISEKLFKLSKKINKKFIKFLFNLYSMLPHNLVEQISRPLQKRFGIQAINQKIEKIFDVLQSTNTQNFNMNIIKCVDLFDERERNYITDFFNEDYAHSIVDTCQVNDLSLYLPNDILCKVDTTSMSNSLEVRSPLLNHNILAESLSFSTHHNCTAKNSKIILKKILSNYLPKSFFTRPKMGFALPMERWLYSKKFMDFAKESIENTDWESIGFKDSKYLNNFKKKYPYNLPMRKLWLFIIAGYWYKNYYKTKNFYEK